MASERTPLVTAEGGWTTFGFKRYRSGWRNMLCSCICAILIAIFAALLVTTVLYSTNKAFSNIFPDENSQNFDLFNTSWPLKDEINFFRNETILKSSDLDSAINVGLKSMSQRQPYEGMLPKMDIDSPSYRHQLTMKATDGAKEIIKLGIALELGMKELVNRPRDLSMERWSWSKMRSLAEEVCGREPEKMCRMSRFRSPDGSCNNFVNPTWGMALQPFRRTLPPDYADGILAPRKSVKGDLPSAREVSLKIHRSFSVKDFDFTVMLAVWGQFIDHDMTATALSQGLGGEAITCCNVSYQHPECFPVRLGEDDPFYKQYNITCMDFVRSAPAPVCRLGRREQLNQATSFIDGSAIYGNDKYLMDTLRSFKSGELKMLRIPNGEELLPVSMNVRDGCNREEQFKHGRYCFLTGDSRANENLHLISLHLIFARQHNSLARNLSALNPEWDDEMAFQEARKIVGAQLQHITYKEFLPIILPMDLMDSLNLTLQTDDYFNIYNPDVNPTIANSFAASVFRFGHSLLPGLMKLISNDSSSEEYVELHKMLFNPFALYEKDYLEKIIRGALRTSVEKSDAYFSKEVTQNLFKKEEKKNGPCGLDLVSLNIQRGRDHGLPGYTKWRKPCGLKEIKSFDDLENIFDNESLTNIKNLYESVDDIDFFTGGLAEIPMKGGLLGPTFTCLIADQFLRLKTGDRYWYENGDKPQAFTPDQLKELRKTSLARILCDNTNITHTQQLVMKRVVDGNWRKSCDEIPYIKLDAWRERLI